MTPDTALAERPQWSPLALTPIQTHDEYSAMASHLKTIKAFQKRVIAFFEPHKSRAKAVHAGLCDDEKKALAPVLADEDACKRLLGEWDTAQERIRLAEERRLQALARQEAEDRRLTEAAAMEREAAVTGNVELKAEADELIAQPITAPTVFVARETPKVAGISYRENWKYRVVDVEKVPREYLKLDDVKVGQIVRAMKGSTSIPGIEVYAEKTVAAGSL